MGRPRRSAREAEAVKSLANDTAPRLSRRRKSVEVARRVVAAFLADQARTEPFERAIFEAQQAIDPDPAHAIAMAQEGGVASWFAKRRLAQFEARGCTQLSASEWDAETRQLAAEAQEMLARRFRDFV